MDKTIRYGEVLEVAYSISDDTSNIKNYLDITSSNSSRDDSDIFPNMDDVQKFTWEPEKEDI